jgi:hypothetical protein
MKLLETVARIELRRHVMKFSELIAALLRALQPRPQAPMKRRPF